MKRLQYVRYAGVLLAAFLWLNGSGQMTASAAPTMARTVLSAVLPTDTCEEACGPTVDCDEPCQGDGWNEPINNHCGTHSGGASGGQCAGFCEDGYCNGAIGEDVDTCYLDCGSCGDSECTDYWEDAGSCYNDCGSCGDDVCTGGYESCSSCATDCNPGNVSCSGTGVTGTQDCDEGEVRNNTGFCCEIGLLVEGTDEGVCAMCGGGQECVAVRANGDYWIPTETSWPFTPGHWAMGPGGFLGWGCVGTGSSCGS